MQMKALQRGLRIHRAQPRQLVARCVATAVAATQSTRRPIDVIICGGGIGGLTTAVALREAGINARVYEARPKDAALDGPGGIMLQANAEKVLRLLAAPSPDAPHATLSDAIYRVGGPIMSGGFRTDRKGDYLYYADLSSVGIADVQSNGLCISRRSLQQILAAALPAEAVQYGRAFESFVAPPPGQPGRVQVNFADGSSETCDMLVGADGLRSKVRTQLQGGPEPLRYSGTVCWRGRIPLSRIGQGEEWFRKAVGGDSWAEYWGKGMRFGFFIAGPEATMNPDSASCRVEGETQVAWYAFVNRPESWQPTPGADEAAEMRRLFGGFASPVRELVAALEPSGVHVGRVSDTVPRPDPWGAGRVTLLGDAVHAVIPTLGQGGCMAIEDALELANEVGAAALETAGSAEGAAAARLEAALRRYESSRAPRTARVCEQSQQVAQLAQVESDFMVWLRNTIYRLTPKEAGDKQFEYLFKEYVPAWRDGVRVGRPAPAAAPQQPVRA